MDEKKDIYGNQIKDVYGNSFEDNYDENKEDKDINQNQDYEKFNTEKIISDDKYEKDKINSYSNYCDYKNEKYSKGFENDDNYTKEESKKNVDDFRKIVKEEIKKSKRPFKNFLSLVSTALIGTILGGVLCATFLYPRYYKESKDSNPTTNTVIQASKETNIETAVNEKASDSVVGVTTQTRTTNDFFNMGTKSGVGSGVIVSEDGYILTNSHVVSDGQAENINVVFPNKETVEAKLLWNDPSLDLAVLKVDKKGLKPIEIGDSDSIKVGDKAIAIGNPLGLDLQSTLTSGYISGLDRSITLKSGVTMDGIIQTDAAINGGNSGGALLNAKGQLIGINTAKTSTGEGLGFAIPINTAKAIIEKIQKTNKFETVTLGIRSVGVSYYTSMTGEDLGVKDGVVVIETVENTAASRAGLQSKDVILKIGDKKITSMGSLKSALLGFSIGDKTEITILRNGKEMKLNVTFSGEEN